MTFVRRFDEHVCTPDDPKHFHIMKKAEDEGNWMMVFEDIEGEWIMEYISYCPRCGTELVTASHDVVEMIPPPSWIN